MSDPSTRSARSGNGESVKVDRQGPRLTVTLARPEKHAGEIWVESEVGVGTRFSFLLPVEQGKVSDDKKNTGCG